MFVCVSGWSLLVYCVDVVCWRSVACIEGGGVTPLANYLRRINTTNILSQFCNNSGMSIAVKSKVNITKRRDKSANYIWNYI